MVSLLPCRKRRWYESTMRKVIRCWRGKMTGYLVPCWMNSAFSSRLRFRTTPHSSIKGQSLYNTLDFWSSLWRFSGPPSEASSIATSEPKYSSCACYVNVSARSSSHWCRITWCVVLLRCKQRQLSRNLRTYAIVLRSLSHRLNLVTSTKEAGVKQCILQETSSSSVVCVVISLPGQHSSGCLKKSGPQNQRLSEAMTVPEPHFIIPIDSPVYQKEGYKSHWIEETHNRP